MLFDPDFWDRCLAGRGMAPLPRSANPKGKPALDKPFAKPSTKSRIVIPLASKPADYVPGSGPPLQPVSLLLPGDSTAYIAERLLLPSPGLAPNGRPLPKRMMYLVGWRDLPAASKLVPAMQVLDYVSPRTLEDFEERLEQELDNEREKLEAELKSDLAAPQKVKKKRGRPPAHSQIESAVVAEPETVAQAKSRHKPGAMSLSTPKKPRLEEFEWLEEEEGNPSRQIAEEQFQSLHGYLPLEYEMSEDTESPLPSEAPEVMRNDSQVDTVPMKIKQPKVPPKPSSIIRLSTPPRVSNGGQTLVKTHNSPQPNPNFKQSSQIQQGPELSSFIPAGESTIPNPPMVIASEEGKAAAGNPAAAKPKTSKKRPRSEDETPKAEPQGENQGETDWVVERIEDVEYYEVDGRGIVRYFKVSWEGDWPPDQKRTWEPEENIPANLVRNFFKISKSKRKIIAKSGTGKQSNSAKELSKPKQTGPKNGISKPSSHKRGSLKQSKLTWPGICRKYSSVSEAFAGDQDSLDMMDEGYDGEEDELAGDGHDEFFVVTEGGENELQNQSVWPTANAVSTALGVFRGFQ
ncbi:chromo (CHRromatin organization MOdifier) domain-containing protein [Trichoderma breve]|uniref:Chromo (CHRromatin organization MOdifier) domain-containing protein n=1 Tax=Trichoderma breve TaxID=2034170 RepID=A0A9W9E277_9HYPO|nr:chromo (CHRromatin organization MOdifier) domain-containing protein [Trichoderma breve]KAJ4854929.1 chromo (CHRromatin organization MOdifier) domain-containing protein [Trichoderma breve]